jgi:glucose/arabinose dehydrogenase
LLYETSGRERDGSGVEGSGVLWELDPAEQPASPRAVASGLKNAYAHVVDDGVLWATEVAESIGGVTAADELVRVREGADYGWPACVGDRVPVPAFGGDERRCADTAPPAVTFPAGATPTSVVANPFGEGLLVALWNTGEVVVVTPDAAAATETAAASTVLVDGLPRPQHLLVDDGTLLVSDHELGAVWRITADDA